MLVMYHEFEYTMNGQSKGIRSSMVSIGEDAIYTAMSNTVGLPIAIASKLILTGQLRMKGVTLPVHPEIYNPILNELAELGIAFKENEFNL
jgi:saccharopine dehydrogenase-like NADP-dependent oxidoreductase